MAANVLKNGEQPMEDFRSLFDNISDDTAADVDDISRELSDNFYKKYTSGSLVNQFQEMKEELEMSFDKQRTGLEENFETEKNDIVQGFMLEKRILNKEHEKEKSELVSSFVKQREEMLNSFRVQVKQIEQKMEEQRSTDESRQAETNYSLQRSTDGVLSVANEPRGFTETNYSLPNKVLIRVDGNRLTPAEVLSTIELEEKFENEKDSIEKHFRKEKERIKEKIELECEKKLLREKHKHHREIRELQSDIEKLKSLKYEVAVMWKQQASKIEHEFHKERSELENHYRLENETLRKKLEEKNVLALNSQQQEYDRRINELKNELRQIKSDVKYAKNEDINDDRSLYMQHEVRKQVREDFERDTKIIRQQNEKLNADVKSLTTEKYEMARKLRDVENHKENTSKVLKEYSSKISKEYDVKMQKLRSQIEKVKLQLNKCDQEKIELLAKIKAYTADGKNLQERLVIAEQTLSEYEDTVSNMRNENTNLSHEINLLRAEKDDLSKAIEKHQENERMLKIQVSNHEEESQESSGRYVLLEREKLQHERLISTLRKELETNINGRKETCKKVVLHEREADRLRQLLEAERMETKRLHERFKQDAGLLRKKDKDNEVIRAQLDNIKTEFERLQTKMSSDNEKILKSESEKELLETQLQKFKNSDSLYKKHEVVAIQSKYVKEFAKRLDYVKANYEREIKGLKKEVEDLKKGQPFSQSEICRHDGNHGWCVYDNYSDESSCNRNNRDCGHKRCGKESIKNSCHEIPTRDTKLERSPSSKYVPPMLPEDDMAYKKHVESENQNTNNRQTETSSKLQCKQTKNCWHDNKHILNHNKNHSAFQTVYSDHDSSEIDINKWEQCLPSYYDSQNAVDINPSKIYPWKNKSISSDSNSASSNTCNHKILPPDATRLRYVSTFRHRQTPEL